MVRPPVSSLTSCKGADSTATQGSRELLPEQHPGMLGMTGTARHPQGEIPFQGPELGGAGCHVVTGLLPVLSKVRAHCSWRAGRHLSSPSFLASKGKPSTVLV